MGIGKTRFSFCSERKAAKRACGRAAFTQGSIALWAKRPPERALSGGLVGSIVRGKKEKIGKRFAVFGKRSQIHVLPRASPQGRT